MNSPGSTGALHTLFAPQRFVGDHVFLTKSGEVAVLLQVDGIDAECLTDETLEDQHRRLVAADRPFDEHFTTYQYLVKLEGAEMEAGPTHPNPVIRETVRSRLDFLASESGLASISLYRLVLYHPKRKKDVEKNAAFLMNRIRALMESVNDLLGATVLAKPETFRFLRLLACCDPVLAGAEHLRYDDGIDYWMGGNAIQCAGDGSIQGREVLSLRDLPRHTWANALSDLLSIEGRYIICSEYRKLHTEKVVKIINQKQQHFDAARWIKNIPALIQMMLSRGSTAWIVPDESAAEDVSDLSTTIKLVNNGGDEMGYYSLTAVFFDKDQAKAEAAATQAIKVFGDREGSLVRESYGAQCAYLSIIPGTVPKQDFRLRRRLLPASQYVDLSFVYGHRKGNIRKHLLLLQTCDRTPYGFDLQEGDLSDALIFGKKGSGKSVFANLLMDHQMKDDAWLLILDGMGGSFRVLTEKHTGSYYELGITGKWPFTLNPFQGEDSALLRQHLSMLLRICMVSGGYEPDAEKNQVVYEEVCRVMDLPKPQRRMGSLKLPPHIALYLAPWVNRGQYSFVFDNRDDTFAISRMQTVDFSAMKSYPDVLQPLLFHFFYLWDVIVNDPALLSFPKRMVIDEGWKMLNYQAAKDYMQEAGRTWRKRNGGILFLTQSVVELEKSGLLDLVSELFQQKILLANPGANYAMYAKIFDLNEKEVEVYRSLRGKGDMLKISPYGSKRLHVNLTPAERWLYANSPDENVKRDAMIAEHGFEEGLKRLAKGA